MKIKYSRGAAQHIESIDRFIAADSEMDARDTVDAIDRLVSRLADQPELGRPTATPGLRSIVVPRLPYRVFYRVVGPEIRVSMVRHTSRRPTQHLQ